MAGDVCSTPVQPLKRGMTLHRALARTHLGEDRDNGPLTVMPPAARKILFLSVPLVHQLRSHLEFSRIPVAGPIALCG